MSKLEEYTVSGHSRQKDIMWIAVLSMIISLFASYWKIDLPFFNQPETVFSVNGAIQVASNGLLLAAILFYLVDRWLWRYPPFNWFRKIGDFEGRWLGTLNRKDHLTGTVEKNVPVMLAVKQTYTGMSVKLENLLSESLSGVTVSDGYGLNIDGSKDTGWNLNHMFDFDQGSGAASVSMVEENSAVYLRGTYFSSVPRTGELTLRRLGNNEKTYTISLSDMVDRSGLHYIGVTIDEGVLAPYVQKLQKYLGSARYGSATKNREVRDGGYYHLTIVTPDELKRVEKSEVRSLLGKKMLVSLVDVGKASDGQNTAYFIVADCPGGAFLRDSFGLPKKDFHVTLGFLDADVHGIPKDSSTIIRS